MSDPPAPPRAPEVAAPDRRRLGPRLAVSLVIAVGLGWLLWRGGLPVVPDRRALSHVEPWAPLAYLGSVGLVHAFRAARWRHLLRPLAEVPWRTLLATAWLGFAAVLFLPLRMGEVVRPYLMGKHGPVRGWQAAGTVAGERIIDGLVLSSLLAAALATTTPLSPLPRRIGALPLPIAAVPKAAYGMLLLFCVAFAVMALFHFRHRWGVALVEATLGRLWPAGADRLAGVLERVAEGLSFLPSARHLAPFALETAIYWAVNALGLWLLAAGCGLSGIGFGEACVIMGCLGIGVLVPSGPGYFGTYQLAVYVALAMFVPAAQIGERGAAFVFVAYLGQLVVHALGAVAGGILLRALGGAEKLAVDRAVA